MSPQRFVLTLYFSLYLYCTPVSSLVLHSHVSTEVCTYAVLQFVLILYTSLQSCTSLSCFHKFVLTLYFSLYLYCTPVSSLVLHSHVSTSLYLLCTSVCTYTVHQSLVLYFTLMSPQVCTYSVLQFVLILYSSLQSCTSLSCLHRGLYLLCTSVCTYTVHQSLVLYFTLMSPQVCTYSVLQFVLILYSSLLSSTSLSCLRMFALCISVCTYDVTWSQSRISPCIPGLKFILLSSLCMQCANIHVHYVDTIMTWYCCTLIWWIIIYYFKSKLVVYTIYKGLIRQAILECLPSTSAIMIETLC